MATDPPKPDIYISDISGESPTNHECSANLHKWLILCMLSYGNEHTKLWLITSKAGLFRWPLTSLWINYTHDWCDTPQQRGLMVISIAKSVKFMPYNIAQNSNWITKSWY